MNKRVVKLIQTMEEQVKYCSSNCNNCIYKEKEVGYCWYTMTTNNVNAKKQGMCIHFADKVKVYKNIKEMKLVPNFDVKE